VAAPPFTVSADGQEVTDAKTGLIWRRCPESMTASSLNCTGTASVFTHEAALTRASTQATATGVAWRLPSVQELSSIVDLSVRTPAIDIVAFPDTMSSGFWSSSPYMRNALSAWEVDFFDGAVDFTSRGGTSRVRLVRAGQ
jgi:hypothetical protein